MNLTTDWRVGFVDGEGCFFVRVSRAPTCSLGYSVGIGFQVTQSERDIKVLEACKTFFACGTVRSKTRGKKVLDYRVHNLDHHARTIVPFFEKHLLKTSKRQDFEIYRDVTRRLWQRKEQKLPRDKPTLLKVIDYGLRRNLGARDPRVAANLEAIRTNLLANMENLEDRVQPLTKVEGGTERNSLPGKFWPARKA
jgi:hypothetical protein